MGSCWSASPSSSAAWHSWNWGQHPADATGAQHPGHPGGGRKSADAAIADVGGQRRVKDLGGLEAEGLNSVEDALARTEEDGRDVEGELVDHAGDQRLSHGRGPTGDVHTALTGSLTSCGVGGIEAVGDEVERRSPFHLDRIVAVM